jgi:hypothetical protein
MTRLEMVREALARLGEAPPEKITAYIRAKFRVELDARMVPVVRASLRELEMLQRFRADARAAASKSAKLAGRSGGT